MSSKLEKQRHIFSILNSKTKPLETGFGKGYQSENESKANEPPSQARFISQLYHFHKSIVQNINEGLFAIELDGNITFANKSASFLTGYSVEELLDKKVTDFFQSAKEADKFLKLCSLPNKKINDWETSFVKKDNSEMIAGISTSPLTDENNQFQGVVLLFRDLTETYYLKSQVERMKRLASLGEISAGIAHEIRNPLAAIKGASQILQERIEGDDVCVELIDRVVREVDKSNNLLNEFFKFARPTKPKFGFTDIETLIDSVYLLIEPKLKSKNIHFHKNLKPKLPGVYVDESQIEQVLLNLMLNAFEALDTGGTIQVSSYKKRLNLLGEEERDAVSAQEYYYVLVEISDNGPGIEPEKLSKIFNPFFTTKSHRLGLGLSICSRLIEENRGKIDVISKVDKGSNFILSLPTFAYHQPHVS